MTDQNDEPKTSGPVRGHPAPRVFTPEERRKGCHILIALCIIAIVAGPVIELIKYRSSPRYAGSETSDVRYKAAAKALVETRLRDPGSAEFSELRVVRVPGRAVVVCGHVNSRNALGGMAGAQRFIAGPQLLIEEELTSALMDVEWRQTC